MNIEEYIKAEVQLHVACQMLSLTGVNFVPKQADDSHTSVKWDDDKKLIIGRTFGLKGSNYQLFVDPIGFALGIMKNDSETDRISLDGLTYLQTLEPWKKWFSDAGFNGKLNTELHYDLPDNDLYKFEAFQKPSETVLKLWAQNRTMANSVFERLTKSIGAPSDINIWPHHFDTGTYYELHKTDKATDRSIGAGFNPADGMVSEPYFYLYAWYKNNKIDYSDKPELNNGKWITDNWEGAVLPITEAADENAVNMFYETTSSYLINKLS